MEPFRSTDQRQWQVVTVAHIGDEPEVHERLVGRSKNYSLLRAVHKQILDLLNLVVVYDNLLKHLLPKLVTQVEVQVSCCSIETCCELSGDVLCLFDCFVQNLFLLNVSKLSHGLHLVHSIHNSLLDSWDFHDRVHNLLCTLSA